MQKFDLTRETALELMVTEFEWEGSFEENAGAIDSAFATRHPESGILNPERVFADAVSDLARDAHDSTGLAKYMKS